jgi:electron transport complex protein RnfD
MTAEAAGRLSTTDEVVLAMLPGLLALGVCFGWGTPVNALWSLPTALVAHRLARGARQPARELRRALPGALVLAIALPPAAPWWLVAGAAVMAASVDRGTRVPGVPRLNPAMAALAVALLLFPVESTRWIAPGGPAPLPPEPLGLREALHAALGLLLAERLDGFTMATPLELLRRDDSHTIAELQALYPQFGNLGALGWDWAALGFLAGGGYLAWRRIVPWQAPAGMLGTLLLLAASLDDGSSASPGPALLHVLGGGTAFAACFVLTEPRGAPRGARGRLLSGALVGVLVFVLRQSGVFADGIAFAVLATNALASALAAREAEADARLLKRRAGAVLLCGCCLLAGWHGLPPGAGADPADAEASLASVVAGAAESEAEPFAVQDSLLLGYDEPRRAWRIRREGRTVAVLLPVRAPQGYAGPIELLVGIDSGGALTGVRVLAQHETPGIGDAIDAANSRWLAGFRGMRAARTDGISGATVSSGAVNAAVAGALRHFAINRATLVDGPATPVARETSP